MISGNKNLSGALKRASIAMMVLAVLALTLTAPLLLPFPAGAEEEGGLAGPGVPEVMTEGESGSQTAYSAQTKELEQATKPGTATKGDIVKAGCNIFSEGPGCVIYWVLDAVSDFVVTTFVSLAALAFDYVVQYAVNYDLAASAFVKTGFAVTIGVANMFFVLLLLWIAIATIFDFEPYTARSLLPKLIIAALLINFSLAIGKSFVRLSNGIAMIFYNNLMRVPSGAGEKFIAGTEIRIPGSAIAHRVMEMSNYTALIDASAKSKSGAQRIAELNEIIKEAECIESYEYGLEKHAFARCKDTSKITAQEAQDAWRERFDLSQSKDDQATLLTAFQAILWKLAMVPVIIFVLLAGIIFIIIRELSLAFILVLGPMAFLFMILPATQRFYNQWWEGLAKWSFFLPAFMFFLFLSLRVGGGILPAAITSSDDRLPVMFQYLMTMALLIGSLIAANQMGIWGASTVTGWGRKMAGAAGGWAKGTGKIWGGAALRRGLLDTGLGRAVASSKYTRWALRPIEAATAAGQKVMEQREKAALQRRAMAAKAAPTYRWALMQGMTPSERADFIREAKPHQLRQVMNIATEDQRRTLSQEMKGYDLEDKVLDAIQDLNSVIAAETNTSSTDPRFQEAVQSWLKSAPKSELQKRISADDIRNNIRLQQAIRERGDMQDIKDIAHTRDKAIALGDWFAKMAGAERQVKELMEQGRTRAQAMVEADVVNTAAILLRPELRSEIQSGPIRLKIEHGIALGKKAPKPQEETGGPEAPPPTP